jgi:hypothetical protein
VAPHLLSCDHRHCISHSLACSILRAASGLTLHLSGAKDEESGGGGAARTDHLDAIEALHNVAHLHAPCAHAPAAGVSIGQRRGKIRAMQEWECELGRCSRGALATHGAGSGTLARTLCCPAARLDSLYYELARVVALREGGARSALSRRTGPAG